MHSNRCDCVGIRRLCRCKRYISRLPTGFIFRRLPLLKSTEKEGNKKQHAAAAKSKARRWRSWRGVVLVWICGWHSHLTTAVASAPPSTTPFVLAATSWPRLSFSFSLHQLHQKGDSTINFADCFRSFLLFFFGCRFASTLAHFLCRLIK